MSTQASTFRRVGFLIIGALASTAPAGGPELYFQHAAFVDDAPPLAIADFDSLTPGDGALTGLEYVDLGLTILNRDGLEMNILTEAPNPFVDPCNFASDPHVISSNFKNADPYFTEAFGDNFDFVFDPPRRAAFCRTADPRRPHQSHGHGGARVRDGPLP